MMDNRMYQRVGANFEVRFSFSAQSSKIENARCVDISADGISFLTDHLVPLHKRLALWVYADKNSAPLCKKGEVVCRERLKTGLFRVGVTFDSASFMDMWRLL